VGFFAISQPCRSLRRPWPFPKWGNLPAASGLVQSCISIIQSSSSALCCWDCGSGSCCRSGTECVGADCLCGYLEIIKAPPKPSAHGEAGGVVASETARTPACPGTWSAPLPLGIPGSVGAAIFLSIMIAFGVIPGRWWFSEKADVINGLFLALILHAGFHCHHRVDPCAYWPASASFPTNYCSGGDCGQPSRSYGIRT